MYFRKILKNKKGDDDRPLMLIMVFIWIVIGAALAWGVILFYSSQADVRIYEANILTSRISSCLSEHFDFDDPSNFNLYDSCSLSQDILENSDNYYLSIKIIDNSSNKEIYNLEKGVSLWSTNCNYQKLNKKIEKNFAQCSFLSIKRFDLKTDKFFTINIIAASNQK